MITSTAAILKKSGKGILPISLYPELNDTDAAMQKLIDVARQLNAIEFSYLHSHTDAGFSYLSALQLTIIKTFAKIKRQCIEETLYSLNFFYEKDHETLPPTPSAELVAFLMKTESIRLVPINPLASRVSFIVNSLLEDALDRLLLDYVKGKPLSICTEKLMAVHGSDNFNLGQVIRSIDWLSYVTEDKNICYWSIYRLLESLDIADFLDTAKINEVFSDPSPSDFNKDVLGVFVNAGIVFYQQGLPHLSGLGKELRRLRV